MINRLSLGRYGLIGIFSLLFRSLLLGVLGSLLWVRVLVFISWMGLIICLGFEVWILPFLGKELSKHILDRWLIVMQELSHFFIIFSSCFSRIIACFILEFYHQGTISSTSFSIHHAQV